MEKLRIDDVESMKSLINLIDTFTGNKTPYLY